VDSVLLYNCRRLVAMATLRYPDEVGYRTFLDKVMAGVLLSRLIHFCLFNVALSAVEFIVASIEIKESEC
jgi:hypothetical protein